MWHSYFLACSIKLDNDTNEKCLEKISINGNDEHDLTKSETERFLTTLNIPTCKCSTKKLQTINTNVEHQSIDDSITCISFDNDSSIGSSLHKNKTKPTSIKCIIIFIETPERKLRIISQILILLRYFFIKLIDKFFFSKKNLIL